jgi:hypothetical protein
MQRGSELPGHSAIEFAVKLFLQFAFLLGLATAAFGQSYSARTDFTAQPYPTPLPCPGASCTGGGALTGAGHQFTPSDFSYTTFLRVTDNSTGGQSAQHSGYVTSCDASSEVHTIEMNNNRVVICQTGNWQQLWSFNSSTLTFTRSTSFLSPGVGSLFFSYTQPFIMYHAHSCSGLEFGCPQFDIGIFSYDTTCPGGIAACNPAENLLVDLSQACNIPAIFGNPSGNGSQVTVSGDDQTFFVNASSTTGSESSGNVYVIAWNRTTGCSYWNTGTAHVFNAGVDQGTITAGSAVTFTIHNVRGAKGGAWVKVQQGVCTGTCIPSIQNYFWNVGTTTVNYANASNSCGHSAIGYSSWVNKCDGMNPPNGNVNGMFINTMLAPNTNVSLPSLTIGYPSPEQQNESHLAWANDNPTDTAPFFVAPYAPANGTTTYAWDNEFLIQPTTPVGSALTYRAFHSYSSLELAYLTESVSQDGKYLLWSPDFLGQLGCIDGVHVGCSVTLADWQANHAYSANTIITPTVGNPGSGSSGGAIGHYSFGITSSCTSGATEPGTWNQALGGSQSDGSCSWTDYGNGRTDVFLAVLPIASTPPGTPGCTRSVGTAFSSGVRCQ